MSLDTEQLWKAVHRIESAETQIRQHADRMDAAAQRIAYLLEDGYGGNGLKLIELLELDVKSRQVVI